MAESTILPSFRSKALPLSTSSQRCVQEREVKRRQQAASAARSEADFNLDRNCHFRQIYEHTEQALDRSIFALAVQQLG